MVDNNIAEIKQKFRENFHNTVLPELIQYEKIRKQRILKLISPIVVSTVLFVTIMFLLIKHFGFGIFQIVLILFTLYGSYISLLLFSSNHNFSEEIKKVFLPKIMTCFGDTKWVPENDNSSCKDKISDEDIKQSNLIYVGGVVHQKRLDNDYFEGTYRGVLYKISETKLYLGKKTLFEGVIIKLNSNKYSYSKTQIHSKNFDNTGMKMAMVSLLMLVGHIPFLLFDTSQDFSERVRTSAFEILLVAISLIAALVLWKYSISNFNKKQNFENISLEDPVFTKKFDVISDDQVESRYLITPSFMERFLNLKTAFNAKSIHCSFYKDSILLALSNNKNLFEIGSMFHPLNDSKQYQKFYDEFFSILMLIDHFNLDKNTGL